jgi:hypothetical protein
MRKCGLQYEGTLRQARCRKGEYSDRVMYAVLAEDYLGFAPQLEHSTNIETIKTLTELMFHNLKISMDTSDWNTGICGAPAWRYIYHTIHSADKFFINPSTRFVEPEPSFHITGLDWPDAPTDKTLDRETLNEYYEQVKSKVLIYLNTVNDARLSEIQEGCTNTRLGLIMEQFRHMYAHIGILNGITIVNTGKYPRVVNSGTWRSGNSPDDIYDNDVRNY